MSDTPYVGPRPFQPGERLFGRDREIRTLYYKLCADRIVLLHSPSGAGKTSLIHAGLLPRMKKEYEIWGPVRLYLPPPGGFPKDTNPFVASVTGGKASLVEYFQERRAASRKNLLVVFDQFEEIITKEPFNRAAKEGFFSQLGEALHDARIWALFSMREDYLAALVPYADLVPTHLLNRLRIDLLSKEAALEAIREPAREAGRPFTPGALADLSRELSFTQAPSPDGKTVWVEGDIIEPLQLQVVCFELWRETSKPKADGSPYTEIDQQVLGKFGNVTESLANYYTSSVVAIAGGDLGIERALRDWVERKLISPAPERIRIQAQRRLPESEGLDTKLIEDGLVACHLVRPETRGTATYFELSHDRLIKPVIKSNEAWRGKHLHEVQVRAEYWDSHDRRDDLLLQPAEYPAAQEWAARHASLTKAETLYLAESRKVWMEEKVHAAIEERHQQKVRRGLYLALGALAVAVVVGFFAAAKWREAAAATRTAEDALAEVGMSMRIARWNQVLLVSKEFDANESRARMEDAWEEALEKENQVTSYRLGGTVRSNFLPRGAQYDLAALLSLLATKALDTYEARNAVLSTVQATPRLQTYFHHPAPLRGVAVSPDGRFLATAATDGLVRLWDVATKKVAAQFKGHRGAVSRAIFVHGGEALASAGADGSVRIWDLRSRAATPLAVIGAETTSGVSALAWSEARQWLAVGRVTGQVELFRLEDPRRPLPLGQPWQADRKRDVWRPGIFDLAFHPSQPTLATSGPSAKVQLWEIRLNGEMRPRTRMRSGNIDTYALAFDAKGERLALAGDPAVEVWDVREWNNPVLRGRTDRNQGSASSVTFIPGRTSFAVGYERESIGLYDESELADPQQNRVYKAVDTLAAHGGDVRGLAPSPDGTRLFSAGYDRDVISWAVDDPGDPLRMDAPAIRGQGGVAFHPLAGGWLMAVGAQSRIRLYERQGAQTREVSHVDCGTATGATSLAFSPDGALLAAGGADVSQPCVWDLRRRSEPNRIELGGPPVEDPHVAFHPARRLLAAGGHRAGKSPSSLVLYDLSQGQAQALPDPPANPLPEVTHIRSLAFNHNGHLLAAGYDNEGVVAVWDVTIPTRSRLLATLRGHRDAVVSVAFHPKGWVLASGGEDRNVVLWDVTNPRSIKQHSALRGHGDWVWSLAFSPDGETLAAGVRNGGTFLWDVISGLQLGRTLQQKGEVFGVAFTPDGKVLASHSQIDGLRLRNLDPARLQDRLCAMANRNLSVAEWQQFVGDPARYSRVCRE